MVTVRDITLTSTCEHHFVTIDGKATVAYIPKIRSLACQDQPHRAVLCQASARCRTSDATDPDRTANPVGD